MQDGISAEADRIDLEERQRLNEGRAAPNAAMQKRIAGRIKEGRDRRKTLDERLSVLAKSLRVAIGLHTIKENEAFYKSVGLGGVLAGIDIAKIIVYIENSPAGAERTVGGMRDLLDALNAAGAALDEMHADAGSDDEDAAIAEIMGEFAVPASDPAQADPAKRDAASSAIPATPESIQPEKPQREGR